MFSIVKHQVAAWQLLPAWCHRDLPNLPSVESLPGICPLPTWRAKHRQNGSGARVRAIWVSVRNVDVRISWTRSQSTFVLFTPLRTVCDAHLRTINNGNRGSPISPPSKQIRCSANAFFNASILVGSCANIFESRSAFNNKLFGAVEESSVRNDSPSVVSASIVRSIK